MVRGTFFRVGVRLRGVEDRDTRGSVDKEVIFGAGSGDRAEGQCFVS